jgi:hypothetical protein
MNRDIDTICSLHLDKQSTHLYPALSVSVQSAVALIRGSYCPVALSCLGSPNSKEAFVRDWRQAIARQYALFKHAEPLL